MSIGKVKDKPVLGWREWVTLPDLDIPAIKVKVDTGARSSSLHACDIKHIMQRGQEYVSFKVHPHQRNSHLFVRCRTPLLDIRPVKSSMGRVQERPVIRTLIALNGHIWNIDLTLTSRDEMGFRMLLGREAIRGRFHVDPGRSFLFGTLDRLGRKKGTRP